MRYSKAQPTLRLFFFYFLFLFRSFRCPTRSTCQADESAQAVGESIVWAQPLLLTRRLVLFLGGEWARTKRHPTMCVWPQVGWFCPRGWWATACWCGFSVCTCVT